MLTWLQNNMMSVLTVWGLLWALASACQNAFAPGSVGYKACHVVLALSPADFAMALRVVGTSMVPPTLALLLLVGVSSSACGGATPAAASPKAQETAQAAVATAAAAWNLAANVCMGVAGVTDAGVVNPALAHECAVVLQPTHDAIVAAGVASNVWDAASQNNFACLMGQIGYGLSRAIQTLPPLPTSVADAAIVAQQFGAACKDGGAA